MAAGERRKSYRRAQDFSVEGAACLLHVFLLRLFLHFHRLLRRRCSETAHTRHNITHETYHHHTHRAPYAGEVDRPPYAAAHQLGR